MKSFTKSILRRVVCFLAIAAFAALQSGCGGGGGLTKDFQIHRLCGDGEVQVQETCDDGNAKDGDGCSASCQFECGNGKVDTGEGCDDGNRTSEVCAYGEESCVVCNSSCQFASGTTWFCGNGAIDGVEECDDGNRITETCEYGATTCDVCAENCVTVSQPVSYCGDGQIDTSNGESCDDGNAVGGDGCGVTCRLEGSMIGVGAFSCALTSTGGVKCWGVYYSGGPTDVQNLTEGVVAVSVGSSHACAVMSAGGLKCWGDNEYGQLGNGTNVKSLIPVDVEGLTVAGGTTSRVYAVSAGSDHTCAVTINGGVKCWGSNERGQLGDGTNVDKSAPVDVQGFTSGAIGVAAGSLHSCAVTINGGVKCWGYNYDNQLGDGTSNFLSYIPVDVSGLTSGVSSVTAGSGHTCAVMTGGAVKCWGIWRGQSNSSYIDGPDRAPVTVTELPSNVVAASAGSGFTCAVTATGRALCWGVNRYGQIGNGEMSGEYVLSDITNSTGAVKAIAAKGGACAIRVDGGVKCWGSSPEVIDEPLQSLNSSSGVKSVYAGGAHTCVLTEANGVKCWGRNNYGQLGDGKKYTRSKLADVIGLTSGVKEITLGDSHSCALTEDNTVKCWGYNGAGQLGDGTKTQSSVPVDASRVSGVISISAGGGHTCAVTDAGGAICWGWNSNGQLGNGTRDDSLDPVEVSGLTNGVSSIAAGNNHTCALMVDGGVKCWGNNQGSQCGVRAVAEPDPFDETKTTTDKLYPVDVTGANSGMTVITAAELFSCSLKSAGGVVCWGMFAYYFPGEVRGFNNDVVSVSAGVGYACAITVAGGVKCWGANTNSMLGTGETAAALVDATDVTGLSSGALSIATGGWGGGISQHTCVVMNDGGVKCWGNNDSGQLGANPGWSPVDVVGF